MLKEKQIKGKTETKVKTVPSTSIMDRTFDMPAKHNVEDYGIDEVPGDSSEDEEKPKKSIMPWAKKEERRKCLDMQAYKNKQYYADFFTCEEKTPDLNKIFREYGVKKWTRTSSAIWNTPPRLSMLPN
ncbi:inner centromere protein-like [Periplaneta americana]|uniref:inner centromere protein-like n=1 Tax=Periplaneta americana TaxID=6978 RepID=UPI0037E80546